MNRFPSSGTIAAGSFPRLVADLHRHAATGSLKVEGVEYRKALYFRSGRILFGSSDDPRDQLGAILVAAGKISSKEVEALGHKVGPGMPLARVLGDGGLVGEKDLAEAAHTKVERILADILTCSTGTFEFEDGVLPKGAVDLRLSTPRLFIAAAKSAGPDLAAVVVGPGEQILRRREGGDGILEELEPEVSSFARGLDGVRSVALVGREDGLSMRESDAVATGLVLLGLAEYAGGPSLEEPPPEPLDPATLPADSETFPGIPAEPYIDTLRGLSLDDTDPAFVERVAEIETPAEHTTIFPPEPLALDLESGRPPVVKTRVGAKTEQLHLDMSQIKPALEDAVSSPDLDPEQPSRPSEPIAVTPPPRRPDPAPPLPAPPRAADFPVPPKHFELGPEPTDPFLRASAPLGVGRPRRSAFPGLVIISALVGGIGVALWLWLNTSPREAPPATVENPGVASPTPAAELMGDAEPPAERPSKAPARGLAEVDSATPPPSSRSAASATPPPQRPRQLAAGYENAAVRLRRGDVSAAARAFVASLPKEGYTIQLLIACSPETAIKAAGQVSTADLFVVPLRFQGRDCYRVLYGRYPSEAEARNAFERSVPAYFKHPPARPRIEALGDLIP